MLILSSLQWSDKNNSMDKRTIFNLDRFQTITLKGSLVIHPSSSLSSCIDLATICSEVQRVQKVNTISQFTDRLIVSSLLLQLLCRQAPGPGNRNSYTKSTKRKQIKQTGWTGRVWRLCRNVHSSFVKRLVFLCSLAFCLHTMHTDISENFGQGEDVQRLCLLCCLAHSENGDLGLWLSHYLLCLHRSLPTKIGLFASLQNAQ